MAGGPLLILGGIAEARELATALLERGYRIIYSIAGLVRQPELPCEIHRGGFSSGHADGAVGMAAFCRARAVALIIDATHPYAVEISRNAVHAAALTGLPCWRLERPGWHAANYPLWHDYQDLPTLIPALKAYRRPFLSVGTSALKIAHLRPLHQTWVVRSARPFADHDGIIQINAIGPFSLQDELELMRMHHIDAVVAKNSGCTRVEAKMTAAKQLGLPVFVQTRPALPATDCTVDSVDAMVGQILDFRF